MAKKAPKDDETSAEETVVVPDKQTTEEQIQGHQDAVQAWKERAEYWQAQAEFWKRRAQ